MRDERGGTRIMARVGGGEPIVAIGRRRRPLSDLYHFLVTSSWPRLFLTIVSAYLAANAAFAASYLAMGDVIENARPEEFADAFFFSVQTMSTVGYGKMVPRTFGANVLATSEVIVGMMGLAVTTGLVFAKFARPTARVMFSRSAVVAPDEGVLSLMFRMANERASHIVEARISAMLARDEVTADGRLVRRIHDLELRRSQSPLFALSWTAVHPIGPDSPLHGASADALAAADAEVVVTLTGFDESLAQTVHARYAYRPGRVVWGATFADMLRTTSSGARILDFRRFDEVIPIEAATTVGRPRERSGRRR